MQNTTDVELGSIDCDKAFQIEIKYDDKLDEKELAYFQIAILFTSCNGQRRLRVHNLALQITSDYSIIYRLIDEDSLVTHLFKQGTHLFKQFIFIN
jgi:protein transport protein SEC24